MSAAPRVLFYVQHLLGIGHLKRAATIARALDAAGLGVTLVSGGPPVPGIDVGGSRFVQLPPVSAADRNFKVLVDQAGRVMDDALRAERAARLAALVDEDAPAVVMTELFPFGRRQLRAEILAMIGHARARAPGTAVVCSVRDILVTPPKPERIDEMLALVEAHYDRILVHGDPDVVPFERTFPAMARIRDKVRYTGYVVETANAASTAGRGEVIVSAGGGAIAEALFEAAIGARALTSLAHATWRLLAGHALEEAAFRRIAAAAPEGVVVERARADFPSLLANCNLSISQGGYNTVMELITAGTRGVIVPYAGALETEQTLRADVLMADAGFRIVAESALAPAPIAEAVEAALAAPPPRPPAFDRSGAATTAALVSAIARDRRA